MATDQHAGEASAPSQIAEVLGPRNLHVVSDWLRLEGQLLAAQRELAVAARQYGDGELSRQTLDTLSQEVAALQELSLAVLARLRTG